MSLVSSGFVLNAVLKDAAGNKSGMRFDVQGADIATAKTNAATIMTALAAITNAAIVSYTIGERFEENATFYGAAGSEVENIASVVTQLAGTPIKYHTFRIPAPVDGLFQGAQGPARNQVDVTDADLLTYLLNFVDETGFTIPGPDAIALVSDGEKLAGSDPNPVVINGKRIHRASTSG